MKQELEIAIGIIAILLGVAVGLHIGAGVVSGMTPTITTN